VVENAKKCRLYPTFPQSKSSTTLTHGAQPKNMKNTEKECCDIQPRRPQKREAPGICQVCPIVNPALRARDDFVVIVK